MRHLSAVGPVLALGILLAAQGSSVAQSTSGNEGAAGNPAGSAVALAGAKGPPGAGGRDGATRDIVVDSSPQLAALATVSKSSDGATTSTPASAALASALQGSPPIAPAASAGGAPGAPAAVTKVASASVYPYRAVGEVEVHYGDNWYYCTGVLIGPHTVATAASCLWGAEGNPVWTDKVVFYPAVNDGNAPFGSYEWAGANIMQGFIDASSSASSDGPLPFGIGLVQLKDAAGDKLGWFGFQTDLNQSYTANAITYGRGDAVHQMSTTTCTVDASTMYRSFAFPNPCPAGPYGSPFYLDDPASKGKILHGMNISSFQDGSTGETRISPYVYQWIADNRN